MQVSLFISCFNDTLFPQTGQAVVSVLERLGHSVDFPMEQTCCGQMHLNSGYRDETVGLMRRFLDVFEPCDVIVCPSSSCVSTVRTSYPRLAREMGDAELIRRTDALAGKVFEFSEFLVRKLGVEDVGAYYPHRVTYHPTCNSLRALKITDAALALLRNVRGLELIELPKSEECCGFGGTFAVKNADTSIAMLTDKLANIRSTQAEVCTAVDNSCLMHIAGGLSRERSGRRALHLAEILASTEEGMRQ
ncbi:L-lactate dehydrogenase complex protein LldE [Faunimonas pinastri]|uniref:L-lactate dehydrogenase complex protein LldE n=1 Tax=Faunimonas pinastri TaxID=1855383 RepID=A0A1H9NTX9_9HYPH|nr:(Fe-S)-binding protein [Faunimonas pinastri]SER39217.1 L-lactate dehydrogenase complex protein LldE [Faunimonas pinastri]